LLGSIPERAEDQMMSKKKFIIQFLVGIAVCYGILVLGTIVFAYVKWGYSPIAVVAGLTSRYAWLWLLIASILTTLWGWLNAIMDMAIIKIIKRRREEVKEWVC